LKKKSLRSHVCIPWEGRPRSLPPVDCSALVRNIADSLIMIISFNLLIIFKIKMEKRK
jgi:hypothetical protein